MTKKQLQAKCDNHVMTLVTKLGHIENEMKSTTSLAGLRRLHHEVEKIQKEIEIVTELAVDLN